MSDTVRTWRHIQQRYNLIGSKCNTCGELFFPSRVVCPNCRRKGDLEPFQFSGKGKIFTYSVIRSAPDDFKKVAPYAVAVIELEDRGGCPRCHPDHSPPLPCGGGRPHDTGNFGGAGGYG